MFVGRLTILFAIAGHTVKTRGRSALENLNLRQQITIPNYINPRQRLTDHDRLIWVGCAKSGITGRGFALRLARSRNPVASKGIQGQVRIYSHQ